MIFPILQASTVQEEEIASKVDSARVTFEHFAEQMAANPAETLEGLVHQAIEFGIKLVAAIIIYIAGAWLIKRIRRMIVNGFDRRKADKTLVSFVASLVSITLTVLLIIITIGTLGINTTSIAALLAAGGMAIGMALGVAAGLAAPSMGFDTAWFKPVGQLFINLIRMVVVPLVFTTLIAGAGVAGVLSVGAGAMAWVVGFAGFFVHGQSDLRRTGPTPQTCDREGFLPGSAVKPYYTGKTRQSSYAVTAGMTHRLRPWLSVFYGAGYGRSAVAWQLAESEGGGYVLNGGLSRKGMAAEAGLVFSVKRVSLAASTLTVAGRQWQIGIGVGIRLGNQKE